MVLNATFAPIAAEILRSMKLAERQGDLLENRGKEKEIDEVGIELGSASAQDDLRGGAGATAGAISPCMGNRVVRIGDAHDPRFEGNRGAAEATWISGAVPAFVVAEDARTEIGIELRQRLEYLGAPLRVGGDQLPFGRCEPMVIVDHVVDGRMDLADVVKERDALDAAALSFVEVGAPTENQRIRSDAPYVGAGLVIVRLDRVQERLESGGRKPLGGSPGRGFTGGEQRPDRADGETGNGTEHPILFSHGTGEGQEMGDAKKDCGLRTADCGLRISLSLDPRDHDRQVPG